MQSFQQNSCHQNATRRGPQTVKVVFDITCGIGDFRVYDLQEQVPTYALSQIDYGHTMDTFEITKRFACAKELRKDILGNLSRVCAWLGV